MSSTNQSERADGRTRDLRGSILRRLRGHTPLTGLLADAESVTDGDGASVIVPTPRLDVQHRADNESAPDVALAVGIVTDSSQRENHHERKNFVVQIEVQIREQPLKWQGLPWVDDIRDEVSAVLTTHTGGWIARGEGGGTVGVLWSEEIDRYRSAQRFDIMRHD